MKLKILDTIYKVIFTNKRLEHEGEMVYGFCHYTKKKLTIYNQKQRCDTNNVLLHEIIHALLTKLGCDELSNNEKFVDRLATGLNCLLQDNPKLLKRFK